MVVNSLVYRVIVTYEIMRTYLGKIMFNGNICYYIINNRNKLKEFINFIKNNGNKVSE